MVHNTFLCRINEIFVDTKIDILYKNRNFEQNSKFWTKIEIFGKKSKFWRKIEILNKNRNFEQKSKFCRKIEILEKNRNFEQNRNQHASAAPLCWNPPPKCIVINQIRVSWVDNLLVNFEVSRTPGFFTSFASCIFIWRRFR